MAARPATGTDDQHLGGRNFTGGGDLAGEETTELVRGFHDGAIATDVGHGREASRTGHGDPGTMSIAITLMLRSESFLTSSGFWAGQMKLTRVAPSLICAISASVGALTLKMGRLAKRSAFAAGTGGCSKAASSKLARRRHRPRWQPRSRAFQLLDGGRGAATRSHRRDSLSVFQSA